MKKYVVLLFMILILAYILPPSDGTSTSSPFDIISLTIKFDRTDAVFTVNYELGKLSKMYILLFGSRSLEPRMKTVFSNFDYEIMHMDEDKAVLSVKNVSRLDKGYYLHDSRELGAGVNRMIVYTTDSPRAREFFNLNSTPNIYYRS